MRNISGKKILQLVSLSVFFLSIAIYAFFGSSNLIYGIKIKNINIQSRASERTNIQSGEKVTDSIIQITGKAENAINLTLNGREISVNEAGDFHETIALLMGYNVVNITAKDKFGYLDEKNYKIILTQALGS